MAAGKKFQKVVITGATGSIGGALAELYAAEGCRLVLQGRRQQLLAQLAEQLPAQVETCALDLTDRAALAQWIGQLCEDPPDLLIANAGMNCHVGADGNEDPAQQDLLIELNVRSTLHLCNRVAAAMQRRGSGQIGLISSLAGYYGLPDTPSYSASKAAIKAYGEGMRAALAPRNVGVTVVMPGYVTSPMCEAMPGPKPFEWPPHKAAQVIARGLARNRARVSFPFPLNFGCWWLAVLPSALSQAILPLLGYRQPHD